MKGANIRLKGDFIVFEKKLEKICRNIFGNGVKYALKLEKKTKRSKFGYKAEIINLVREMLMNAEERRK